jgi:DNA-binding HxlR family transcriptional regulator
MGGLGADRGGKRRIYDQPCPVAQSLDLLGERWTLLIVRDLMFGPLRFTDLREGLPGMAPNLLSERLRFLVGRGVIEKTEQPSPGSRNVYRLTARGRELAPVIHALARFGVDEWADPDEHPPTPRLLRGALLALMTPDALDDAAWQAVIVLPESSLELRVGSPAKSNGALGRLRLKHLPSDHQAQADTAVLDSTLATLRALRRGTMTTDTARRNGTFRYRGSKGVEKGLGSLFGWDAEHCA